MGERKAACEQCSTVSWFNVLYPFFQNTENNHKFERWAGMTNESVPEKYQLYQGMKFLSVDIMSLIKSLCPFHQQFCHAHVQNLS